MDESREDGADDGPSKVLRLTLVRNVRHTDSCLVLLKGIEGSLLKQVRQAAANKMRIRLSQVSYAHTSTLGFGGHLARYLNLQTRSQITLTAVLLLIPLFERARIWAAMLYQMEEIHRVLDSEMLVMLEVISSVIALHQHWTQLNLF